MRSAYLTVFGNDVEMINAVKDIELSLIQMRRGQVKMGLWVTGVVASIAAIIYIEKRNN